ncbi:MAG: DUF1538 domain-containing protein [Fusobacteria bacterium]|nr:DUF1538 domain-containing protein [Fusobacteriota bacterium]
MNALMQKLKEVAQSIIPIIAIVIILDLVLLKLPFTLLLKFFIGAFLIFLGLSLFLVGVENGLTPIGQELGKKLTKKNNLLLILLAGLALGFIISIAESDLHTLANLVEFTTLGQIDKYLVIFGASIGVAVLLAIGIIRIANNISLRFVLLVLYGIILILAIFVPKEFIPIAFDASGATTGAMTVPFILAIAFGVSQLKKNSQSAENDSLGLVGLVSGGIVIAILLLAFLKFLNISFFSTFLAPNDFGDISLTLMVQKLQTILIEIFLALSPIILIFLLFVRDVSKLLFKKHLLGLIYTYIGMVLFSIGINYGFMPLGKEIGEGIYSTNQFPLLLLIAFILGFVTVLSEPTVHVLTNEIEDITSGYIPKSAILLSLSIAVGLAVVLSMLRITINGLELWHILLPGYLFAFVLSFFSPKVFVGMAFDSGAVASGPMTVTFIMAFSQGVAGMQGGSNLIYNSFGLIALVAMMPIITLQILGIIFKIVSTKEAKNVNK